MTQAELDADLKRIRDDILYGDERDQAHTAYVLQCLLALLLKCKIVPKEEV